MCLLFITLVIQSWSFFPFQQATKSDKSQWDFPAAEQADRSTAQRGCEEHRLGFEEPSPGWHQPARRWYRAAPTISHTASPKPEPVLVFILQTRTWRMRICKSKSPLISVCNRDRSNTEPIANSEEKSELNKNWPDLPSGFDFAKSVSDRQAFCKTQTVSSFVISTLHISIAPCQLQCLW